MKYVINQEPEIQTVTVEVRGTINTRVAEEMVLVAGLELNYTDFQKCFIDLTNSELDPNQTMSEMFMFVETYKRAGIKKSVKMAAMVSTLDKHRLHLEKAAVLEGYKLKHFKTRNEALYWLDR
jgi:hypothetical protein